MITYIIRRENPLDMEGYADIVTTTLDKDVASAIAARFSKAEEVAVRARWGDHWAEFAHVFYINEIEAVTDAEAFIASYQD